jgi:glycosyltransferase involved in cell wall biosynthesis
MTRVLIAHQSGIPHYRVPFYTALERQSRPGLTFDVAWDPSQPFMPGLPVGENPAQLPFSTVQTRTFSARFLGRTIRVQDFLLHTRGYDLVVVEHALNNLSYPLSHVLQLGGMTLVYWGHGRDIRANPASATKWAAEALKLRLARLADGYFAYTDGVKAYLVHRGLPEARIHVLNNTIDILTERELWARFRPERSRIRAEMGLEDKRVLVFVGRFRRGKRLGFLRRAFQSLRRMDPSCCLLLVGEGDYPAGLDTQEEVRMMGPILEPERLARILVAGDAYVIAGDVGLGPLQAMCYDLPVVAIQGSTHGPEFEYLTADNAIVLPHSVDAEAFAWSVHDLLEDPARLDAMSKSIWPSIAHLTVENMADRFITGVETTLAYA